ncbi:MAG: hypothetical protein KTR21_09975 [Rhodobacteraceae bacterium]|nr:hypothetical protein [Paracoccaceae bacterium]
MFLTQSLRDDAAPLQQAAWRRFAEWTGAPLVEVSRPYLYCGRSGRRALAELAEGLTGCALEKAFRIALEPPEQFEPLPDLLNALTLTWPYSGAPPRGAARAPLLLAGSRHTLALLRREGGKAVLAPAPLAVAGGAVLPSGDHGLAEITVWWTHNGAGELAPGRLTDFLAARRGTLFCARLLPNADPRALRSLLIAAEALTTGRLLVVIADETQPFDALREAFDLDESGFAAHDRLGFVVESSDMAAGDAIASAAQFAVAPTSSTAARAAEDHLWIARAVASGCVPIGPAGGGLEDLLPEHPLCRPLVERPQAWELEAAWRDETSGAGFNVPSLEVSNGPPLRGWVVPGPVLGKALSVAERVGETELSALGVEALSRVRADRGYQSVQDRLTAVGAQWVAREDA